MPTNISAVLEPRAIRGPGAAVRLERVEPPRVRVTAGDGAVIEHYGIGVAPLDARRVLRAVTIALLGAGFLIALALAIHNVYTDGARFPVAGIGFSSSGLFRPVVVAALCWLGVAHLTGGVRPRAVIFCACAAAYAMPVGAPLSGDVIPTQYAALSIATGRGTALDGYPELIQDGIPYYLTPTAEGLRSSYPIGGALVSWPLFLPAPHSPLGREELVDQVGRFAAILIALAAVLLAHRIAERLDPPFSPALLAFAYGLGTSHWSTSAFALWQHGPAELWLLGALERLTDRETRPERRLVAAGAALALAVITRPSLAFTALLLAGIAVYFYQRRAWMVLLTAALVALPVGLYHVQVYGSWLGGYVSQVGSLSLKPFGESLSALWGLVASPSRGLLFYQPVVALTLVAAVFAVARRPNWALLAGLAGFAGTLALYSQWSFWWGGHAFGPRLLTDSLPWWLLATASVGRLRPGLKKATLSLIAWGAVVNAVGVTTPAVFWDGHPSVDLFRDRLSRWSDSQLLLGALGSVPGVTRQALVADVKEDREEALQRWQEEWERRPWHRFAAARIADLLVRVDRLEQAESHLVRMSERWPDDLYVHRLMRRLPDVEERLHNWVPPRAARASRHSESAERVHDGRLGTRWSTRAHQRRGDWLELEVDPAVPVQGVGLFSFPDFHETPGPVSIFGVDVKGATVDLGDVDPVWASTMGWVALRFEPRRLTSVRIRLQEGASRPWSVAEARLILAPDPGCGRERVT